MSARCSGWYYKGVVWKNDSLIMVKANSQPGGYTRNNLVVLARQKQEALDFLEALDYLRMINSEGRDPFGCAEPDAVYKLLDKGASLNQIFISITREERISKHSGDYWKGYPYDAALKPCSNCSLWLSEDKRQGVFMVDLQKIYHYRDLFRGQGHGGI
jgi:hypothetical protein